MRYILIIFVLIILADRTVHPTSISSEYTSAEYPTIGVNAEFTMQTELLTTYIDGVLVTEKFVPIKGYEGLYEISNFGRVKSLPKRCITNTGGVYNTPERILKPFTAEGYHRVCLLKSGIRKTHTIHRLVWEHFGQGERDGHKLEVDHIDNNKSNNRIDNLQLLTARKNSNKYRMTMENKKSKYIGVGWHKHTKKWMARLVLNGKRLSLGCYVNEIDAANAYQNKLAEINELQNV
jgi:hypothetical protein